MIISIREAYLGKRELKPLKETDGWVLGKKGSETGWTEEFMQARGLKDKNEGIKIKFAVESYNTGTHIFINDVGYTINGTDYAMDYWFYDSPYGLLVFEIESHKYVSAAKIKQAILNNWDGSVKSKIML